MESHTLPKIHYLQFTLQKINAGKHYLQQIVHTYGERNI